MSNQRLLLKLKTKARALKQEVLALYLASKHPDVPWYAKLCLIVIVAYALSPIDLIPDFIPVLGYLDDLILLPLGLALVIKLVPEDALKECRAQAEIVFQQGKPRNWTAGIVIVALWLVGLGWLLNLVWRLS